MPCVLGRRGGGGGGVPSSMFPAMCPMVNKMLEDTNGPGTACGEGHILELWAVNGTFNSESENLVNALTDEVHASHYLEGPLLELELLLGIFDMLQNACGQGLNP